MSNKIDQRIVEMSFENSKFEKGIHQSKNSLKDFSNVLNQMGNDNGFQGLENSISSMSKSFSVFEQISIGAIRRIGESAVNMSANFLKNMTSSLREGGKRRALNIEQAKFQFEGLSMDIEATMADANYAVDGTAYSLDAAAKVASQLGASGLRAGEQMRASLRAVSGVAAMAGSSYEDIGNVFTKVAGQGRLMGDDLLRLSSRGINAAATLAKEMGTTEAAVRKMVTKGQIDFHTFSKAMDSAFGEHATAANKTFTGSLANMRSALARIGEKFYTPFHKSLIDPFNALRLTINDVNKALDPMFDKLSKFMEVASGNFVASLTEETSSLKNVFSGLKNILIAIIKPLRSITQAFDQMFPAKTKEQWLDITAGFKAFTSYLIISDKNAKNIKRTFAGLFAIIDLAVTALKTLGSGVLEVLKVFVPIGDGAFNTFTSLTATIGDFLVILNHVIKSSGFFQYSLLAVKVAAVLLRQAIVNMIGGISIFINGLREAENPLQYIGETITNVFGNISKYVQIAVEWLSKHFVNGLKVIQKYTSKDFIQTEGIFSTILTALKDIINVIVTEGIDAFKGLSSVIDGLNLNKIASFVIGGFLLAFVYQLTQLSKATTNFTNTVTGFIGVMKSKLFSSSNKFQDLSLLIGVLAGSLILLSKIPFDELKHGLVGLAGAIGLFVLAYGAFQTIGIIATKVLKGQKMAKTAFELVTLAGGLAIMAAALKIIAGIQTESIWKAVGVVGALLTFLTAYQLAVVGIGLISKTSGLTVSIAGMAAGILALIAAIKLINHISNEEIDAGMIKISSILIMIGLIQALFSFAARVSKSQTLSTSILGMAAGVLGLIVAIKLINNISKEEINSGLSKITSILVVLATIQLLFALIARIGEGKKASVNILTIAGGVFAMIGLIKLVNFLEKEEINSGLQKITQIMTVLAVIQLTFTMINTIGNGKTGTAILSITGAMAGMVGLIAILNIYSEEQINHGLWAITKMAGIIVGIQLFTAIAARIGGGAKVSGSLLAVTTLMVAMGGILALLSVLPPESLKSASIAMLIGATAIGIIILALSALSEVVKKSSKEMFVMAASLLVFAIAVKTMTQPIVELSKLDTAGMFAGVAALGLLVGLFSGMALLLDKFKVGAVSLLALSGALIGFGAALLVMSIPMKTLSTIDPKQIWTSVGAFTALLAVFTAIGFFNQTGGIAFGMITAAAGVAAFGAALIVVTGAIALAGFGFKLGAEAISILVDSFATLVQTIKDNRETLVSDFAILGEAIATGIFTGIKTFFANIGQELNNVWNNIKTSVKEFFGINSPSTVMAEIGESIPAGLLVGIKKGVANAVETAKNMASDVIKAVKKKFDSNSPSKVFSTIGGWCTIGLANGITKETKVVTKASSTMAKNVEDAVRNSLDVHSESKKFVDIGEWLPKSVSEGIQNGKGSLVSTAKNLGIDTGISTIEGITSGFSEKEGMVSSGLSTILDILQGNTTIKEATKNVGVTIGDGITGDALSALTNPKTGLGGVRTQKVVQTELEKLQGFLEEEKFYSRLSLDQELREYEKLRASGKLTAEDRKKVDREIYQLSKTIYDAQMQYIDDITKANADNTAARKAQNKQYQADRTQIEKNAEADRKALREQYAKDQLSINEKLLTDISSQNKVYEDAFKSRTDEIYNSYGLFDSVERDGFISGKMLLQNLRDQEDALHDWQESLEQLKARGIDEGLFEEIQEMGPASKAQIKGLLALTDIQLDEYVALYQNKYMFAREKAEIELTELKETTEQTIQDLNTQAAIDLSSLEKEFTSSMSKINTNMKNDLAVLKANHKQALSEIKEDLATQLSELKDNFNTTMRNINGMTEQQYSELIAQNNFRLNILNSNTKKSMDILLNTFLKSGTDITSGFNNSMTGLDTQIDLNLTNVNTAAQKQLDTTKKIFTSSGEEIVNTTNETGQRIITNSNSNMSTLNQQTKENLGLLKTNISSELDPIVKNFNDSGYNAAAGFAEGIKKGTYLAVLAAQAMANAAKRAAEKALEESSPSKVFERIGRFVSEGFANGIIEYTDRAIQASKEMASGPIAVLSKAIAELESMIDENLEFEPVITPILDLSNMKSNELSKLIGNQQYTFAQESTQSAQEMIQNGRQSQDSETNAPPIPKDNKQGNSYQFVQNNYSPKPLPRIDIYRNSRNQFFEFKTLVGD